MSLLGIVALTVALSCTKNEPAPAPPTDTSAAPSGTEAQPAPSDRFAKQLARQEALAEKIRQRWTPQLHAAILDSEETLEVAQDNIARQKLEDRVSIRVGDAFVDDLGGPYDFIFISNLLHIYSEEENRNLLTRCAKALEPGGRLAVKDFLLDPDRLSPAGGAVFAVNMLVSTEGGDSCTAEEVQRWLEDAGLQFESLANVATHSRILVASKPE